MDDTATRPVLCFTLSFADEDITRDPLRIELIVVTPVTNVEVKKLMLFCVSPNNCNLSEDFREQYDSDWLRNYFLYLYPAYSYDFIQRCMAVIWY